MTSLYFFIDNKLGGVSSLNLNLIRHVPEGFEQQVIHITNPDDPMTRADIEYPVRQQLFFNKDNTQNLYEVISQLRSLIPDQPGTLVLNYDTEMAMLDHYPVVQGTVQLVHDDFNVRLAATYGHVVDAFICHNRHIEASLRNLFPQRQTDIHYIPHGVALPVAYRQPRENRQPLKLVFLGRITTAKGVFDLPIIAHSLRKRGVEVEWTCIGSGPESEAFQKAWSEEDRVRFLSPKTSEEVLACCATQDLFVLPTRFEGTPVSLLETMSVGLVPVISNLPGGIQEIVSEDIGFRPEPGDTEAFAEAIQVLHQDRDLLNRMSQRGRQTIRESFLIQDTARRYFEVFRNAALHPAVKKMKKGKLGSRLDHPWIPFWITRLLRRMNSQKK